MDGFVFLGFICMLTGMGVSCLYYQVLRELAGYCAFILYNCYTDSYWILGYIRRTIVLSILDYIIPAKGTKRFGGSRYGIWGTNIGLVVGLLTPIPFGF
jgi:uncharacterized protein YqgC (DUF456 family)